MHQTRVAIGSERLFAKSKWQTREGGMKLAASLAEAGLIDEWLSVVAPAVIGGRRIGRAVRGKIAGDGVFAAFGDGFVRAHFG